MGGSSVHFDRSFLDTHFPACRWFVTYRNIDVSTIRSVVKAWWPEKVWKKGDAHRAYEDIVESIQELRYYKTLMGKGFEFDA